MASVDTAEHSKLYEEIIDVFAILFGKHARFRSTHAKGLVCHGTFTPNNEASKLCRAKHFAGTAIPVTVRFSDFTGIPTIPDGDPNASPRGFAVRFHTDAGETDIVSHSYNGFPVGTAEEFLNFAKALANDTIVSYASTHPAVKTFLETPKPTPASFANESFFGVNAFRFLNAGGDKQHVRYQILPVAGEARLTSEEAAKKPANFLFDELTERLKKGAVEFELFVQVANSTDTVNNGSIVWPSDRPKLSLGKITVTSVADDSQEAERKLIFDPVHLIDGIELSDDPLVPARSAIYSVSYSRRNPT